MGRGEGYSKFRIEILEYCEPTDTISREQYYLDKLKPEYNILTKAGSSLGFKHSEETLVKLRGRKLSYLTKSLMKGRLHTEEAKAKISAATKGDKHPLFGKTHTEETRAKMAAANKGNKNRLGKSHTEETKAKMREANLGENNPMFGKARPEGAGSPSLAIEVTDVKTNETTTYDSLSAAARALNINKSTIGKYLTRNQKKPYKGRYIFHKL